MKGPKGVISEFNFKFPVFVYAERQPVAYKSLNKDERFILRLHDTSFILVKSGKVGHGGQAHDMINNKTFTFEKEALVYRCRCC